MILAAIRAFAKEVSPKSPTSAAQPHQPISAGIAVVNQVNADGSLLLTHNGATGVPALHGGTFTPTIGQSVVVLVEGTRYWAVMPAGVTPTNPASAYKPPIQVQDGSYLYSGSGSPAEFGFTAGQAAPPPGAIFFGSDGAIPGIWQLIAGSWVLVGGDGSGGYRSLTGAGQTETPGNLTQTGGLAVIGDFAQESGSFITESTQIDLIAGATGLGLETTSSGDMSFTSAGILHAQAVGTVTLESTGADVNISGVAVNIDGEALSAPLLPTSDPHVADQLWNNSGVVTVSAG